MRESNESKLLAMTPKEFDEYMVGSYPNLFKQRYAKEGQEVLYPVNYP